MFKNPFVFALKTTNLLKFRRSVVRCRLTWLTAARLKSLLTGCFIHQRKTVVMQRLTTLTDNALHFCETWEDSWFV